MPNGEARTHLERATFNDASISFESPDTDELGALGVSLREMDRSPNF